MIMLLSDKIRGWGVEFHRWLTRPSRDEIHMWLEGRGPEAIYKYRRRTGLGLRKAIERMERECRTGPRHTPNIFQVFHYCPPWKE